MFGGVGGWSVVRLFYGSGDVGTVHSYLWRNTARGERGICHNLKQGGASDQ